jgi:hypothetical protein
MTMAHGEDPLWRCMMIVGIEGKLGENRSDSGRGPSDPIRLDGSRGPLEYDRDHRPQGSVRQQESPEQARVQVAAPSY